MEFIKYIDDKPSAWRGHIDFAYQLVADMKPRVIVELGVMYGHSFFSFAQSVKDHNIGSVLYGIDTFEGDRFTGTYTQEVRDVVDNVIEEVFPELDIRIIQGTFQEVAGKVKHKIDLLHIDGSHDYESVRKDWDTYSPKLRKDAVVLFHDTQVTDFGVNRLFTELKAEYPQYQFQERIESYGLGIIYTGDTYKQPIDN